MKKLFLIISIFVLFSNMTICQSLRKNIQYYDFAYLENTTDTSKFEYLKRLSVNAKSNEDIYSMFKTIRLKAKGMEANCFKFQSFSLDSSGAKTLVLDVYSGDYPEMKMNFESHDKNTIYVLGDDRFDQDSSRVSIDNEEVYIKSGSYIKNIIKLGEKVKIGKGGVLGSVKTFKWEDGSLSKFITTTGFGFNGIVPTSDGVGISITTGKIYLIDYDFGRLLIDIFKQQQ